MHAARYWVGVMAIAFGSGALLFWFSIHPFIGFWRRIGAIRTLVLHYVAVFALAACVIWQRERIMIGDFGTHWPLLAFAAILLVISVMLRSLQARVFGTRILLGLPELNPADPEAHLVTQGIYARIRHPRYVQLLLSIAALALFANYLSGYLLLVFTAVALLLVVALEERELLVRFGDSYRDYMARVPRFVPRRILNGARR
jgi:protein-S-isoprenylcysteine O-methyltransferase Ste14